MIDTHSHIYLPEFDEDRDAVIMRAQEAGVKHIILPAVDFESFPAMWKLHDKYPEYTSLAMGLHPTSVNKYFKTPLEHTLMNIFGSQEYVAVGEIGLDLYWSQEFLEEQVFVFMEQMMAARQIDLPVIIHCRNAIYEILAMFADILKEHFPPIVFHSFTGTPKEVQMIRSFGKHTEFYFGINGISTFKKANLDATIKEIGLEHLLLETDSPYLAPVPYRGKRNESAYVAQVCKKVAEVLGVSYEEVDEITTRNANSIFTKR